jgi:hypothetical protein
MFLGRRVVEKFIASLLGARFSGRGRRCGGLQKEAKRPGESDCGSLRAQFPLVTETPRGREDLRHCDGVKRKPGEKRSSKSFLTKESFSEGLGWFSRWTW